MAIRWHSEGETALPVGAEWLAPHEAEIAGRMRFAKRRSDYLLGRWTAKRAVARALGLPLEPAALARIGIRNDADGPRRGAPNATVDGGPAGLEISITDRAGWGVCAVRPPGAAIGCDLELVEARSNAFVADFFTQRERDAVAAAASEEQRHERANLLWCAKESALKVLGTGLRRDTRSVEVTLGGAPDASGWHPLRVRAAEGADYPGWWRRFGVFLLTFAAEVETPPPVALVEPPGLAAARPSHAWMDQPRAGAGQDARE